MTKQAARTLRLTISEAQRQLDSAKTAAEVLCLKQTILAAEAQLSGR